MLTRHLLAHWLELIRDQKPLDDRATVPAAFQASIDPDTFRITVDGRVDLLKTPLATLEKVALSLQQLQVVVNDYRRKRGAVEGPEDLTRRAAEELKKLTAPEVDADGAAEPAHATMIETNGAGGA